MKTRLIRLYSDIDKLELNLKDLLKELEVSEITKERILASLGLFIDELIDSTERYLEEDEGIEESFKPDPWRVVYILTGRGGKTKHSARNNIAGLRELIKTIRFYNRDVIILGEIYTPEEAIRGLERDIEEFEELKYKKKKG